MSSLLNRLKNTSKHVSGHILSEADAFDKYDPIPTGVPILNFALSGHFGGGLLPGTLVIAAKSKRFKTLYGLLLMKAFQKKYSDGATVFYDSEYGARPSYFENMGIDTGKVIWKPLNIVQRWTHDCYNVIDALQEDERAFIFVDSLGNMGSLKEVEDAKDGKDVADMTRAKAIKSAFRVLNLNATLKGIPMVIINHTYDEQAMYGKEIISGGCVVRDTPVMMGDRTCKMIQDVEVGDYVWSIGGPAQVTHTWTPETLEDGEPECYEVEFEDGSVITCSDKHRFMGADGEWVYVTDLEPGMELENCWDISMV